MFNQSSGDGKDKSLKPKEQRAATSPAEMVRASMTSTEIGVSPSPPPLPYLEENHITAAVGSVPPATEEVLASALAPASDGSVRGPRPLHPPPLPLHPHWPPHPMAL
jgi:hypothetical protein